jgi:hypothetical protein
MKNLEPDGIKELITKKKHTAFPTYGSIRALVTSTPAIIGG